MGKSTKPRHLDTTREVATIDHEAAEKTVNSAEGPVEMKDDARSEDAAATETGADEPAARVKKKRGPGCGSVFLAGITGGIIALGGGAALQQAGIFPSFPVDADTMTGLSDAGVKDQLSELKNQLATISAMPGGVALGEKERALLAEAQQNAAQARAMVADVQKQARSVLDAVGAIRKELSGSPDEAAVGQLQKTVSQRISALEAKLNELDRLKQDVAAAKSVTQNQETQLETLKKGMTSLAEQKRISGTGVTLFVAASALKAAVDRGGSYISELQTFAAVAPPDVSLNLLKAYADKGLPSAAELSGRFAKVADKIAQTENKTPENAGMLEKLWADVRTAVTARPVGNVDGNTPGAIAARMEVAIAEGDYARAINEWKTLPPRAQSVSADFMKTLQARYEVDNLLARFVSRALSPQ